MLVMLLNQRGVDHVRTRNKSMRSEGCDMKLILVPDVCPPSQLNREMAATPPKSNPVIHPTLARKGKQSRVFTQCGRNAIPETVTQQVNLFQPTGQKTAVHGPNLKDKKKEITWETNE